MLELRIVLDEDGSGGGAQGNQVEYVSVERASKPEARVADRLGTRLRRVEFAITQVDEQAHPERVQLLEADVRGGSGCR